MNLALVGNPNVGKTTFFNFLTKSFEHTGNWHGVTVDKKEKKIVREDKTINVIDLPGVYSLTSFSFEEQVTIDFLRKENSVILNIIDGNVLARNLYLTLELIEMGLKPRLLVNFDKEVKNKGISYDYELLSKILNLKIFLNSKINKNNVLNIIKDEDNHTKPNLPYLKDLPLEEIKKFLPKKLENKDFFAIKILENDENIIKSLNFTEETLKKIKKISEKDDFETILSQKRYEYIDKIISQIMHSKKEVVYGKFKIDKIILNKFLCLPIFFLILFTIFYITFSSVGSFLSEGLKYLLDILFEPIINLLIKINAPPWIIGLFSSGILGGVGGLLSFIPQIVLLFTFLSILEDSGYLSRLAFVLEDIFYKFGLSGKSIFTILMSFGCTTTAVLTSRNIEDKNTKIKTAMISPYMSCSAKLPIYAVIGGAFFGKGNIFIIIALYILGVIVGLLMGKILNSTTLKSGERSFILEFPPYRRPSIKQIALTVLENCKSFIIKVSTVLLSFSVIVFILQNFTFKFEYIPTSQSGASMLEIIGRKLAVIFRPIGLGNWGVVASLLVGIMAKEMVVGTMAIINKVPTSRNFDKTLGTTLLGSSFAINFTPQTALIMLVFSLLYMPCISTIAVLRKEIGLKYTILACVLQFFSAYTICFLLYNFLTGTLLARILITFGVIIAFILLCKLSKKVSSKGLLCNKNCKKCKENCR